MNFRNLSIRHKLTALMMLISVLILSIGSCFYIAEEIYSTRIFLERELTSLGSALGDSSKIPLMTQRIDTTEDILGSLQGHSSIRAAFLFDQDGEPAAHYVDHAVMPFVLDSIAHDFPTPLNKSSAKIPESQTFSSFQHFSLILPILHNNQQIGSLYLLSDLASLYVHLYRVAFVILALLGILLLLSWWLAGRLQRPVSGPVLSLVDTMEVVSRERNFSVRASKQGFDEIGQLVDGFNQMLEQIEQHRQELIDHQQTLEETVDKRTEELRQMVSVLEFAKKQAEGASEAKSQFLANITHELRTPLIGVLGMNELMNRTSMDEQQQMLVKTVQNSGEDLLELINNVLDFSKIEAGKMQLEEEEFSLYQVVDEVLNLLADAAAEKGLTLYSRIPLQATCKVVGDPVRIRQILMNLIGNAIKFTEQGSVTVNLDCRVSDDAAAAFTLEVIDTGIGMSEAAQEQIFSVFYQADASHTRKYGGTGLGLTIVQQLVKLLEGSIELQSQPGKGSCFQVEFCLPMLEKSALELPESLQRQPVLVHLSDDTCQQILSQRLAELDVKVTTAESVADAWYQLGSAERAGKPFALILFSSAATLPDGQPLYQAIRDEDKFCNLRRVLVTERTHQLELRKQERKVYLPFGWDSLLEALSQCWHELHLVETAPAAKTVTAPSKNLQVSNDTLLLVGGSVASRELIKISLRNQPLAVEVMTDFELLSHADPDNYVAMLVDLAAVSVAQVEAVYRQRFHKIPLFVLTGPTDDWYGLEGLADAILQRPFKADVLMALLPVNQNAEEQIPEWGAE